MLIPSLMELHMNQKSGMSPPFIRKQVLKDAELIAKGRIQGATWHFYRSATTGKAGPSAPLEKFLREHGINIVKHY